MPRRARFASGGFVYHVLNRRAGRQTLFQHDGDFQAFLTVLEEARSHVSMRLLSYTVMPNHWHLVLWPKGDGDLSEYMRWLTVAHTQRWHARHHSSGTGPLYQGRFKSFPVEGDDHLYRVCRYVERNALRARLVTRAEMWRWSSLWQYANGCWPVSLDEWPVPQLPTWMEYVNGVETEAELAAVRTSVKRGCPYGSSGWQRQTAIQLGLESTLRSIGRPRGT